MQPKAPPGSNSNERYFPAFDGVRAVAILMVFFCHYLQWKYGTYGVNFFFVLSGFLITGVLYDSRDALHRFRNFYIRRTLRIFPVYYAFWILLLLLTPLLGLQWTRGNWLYTVYLGNYIHTFFGSTIPTHPGLLDIMITHVPRHHLKPSVDHLLSIGHFWSLCVEEQFYLVWPFVVYFVGDRRKLIRICLYMIVLVPLARLVAACIWPNNPMAIWAFTWLRFDEFLIGGAAALLVRSGHVNKMLASGKYLLTAGVLISVLGAIARLFCNPALWFRWQITGEFAAIDALAVGLLMVGMQEQTLLARALSWTPLRALGRISYGFYIFHDIPHYLYADAVGYWLRHNPSHFSAWLPANIWTAVLAFPATLVISTLDYKILEQPFLRLKNRWAPSRRLHAPVPRLEEERA